MDSFPPKPQGRLPVGVIQLCRESSLDGRVLRLRSSRKIKGRYTLFRGLPRPSAEDGRRFAALCCKGSHDKGQGLVVDILEFVPMSESGLRLGADHS
jgi:hypothetical protein